MSITRDFKLSLVAGRSVPLVINANQYDDGEVWRFTLLDENGQKYSPSTGSIIGLKSDGHIIANAGTVSSTGLVIIAETEQMTASPGKNFYELLIDDDTHGTANFVVFVEPRPGADGTPSDSDLAVFQEAIDAAAQIGDASELVDDVAVLKSRMDEFTTLTDGSTTGDAELADIRVGADGTIYPNAGDAVRGQVSDLKNALSDINGSQIKTKQIDYSILTISENKKITGYDTSTFLPTLANENGSVVADFAIADLVMYDLLKFPRCSKSNQWVILYGASTAINYSKTSTTSGVRVDLSNTDYGILKCQRLTEQSDFSRVAIAFDTLVDLTVESQFSSFFELIDSVKENKNASKDIRNLNYSSTISISTASVSVSVPFNIYEGEKLRFTNNTSGNTALYAIDANGQQTTISTGLASDRSIIFEADKDYVQLKYWSQQTGTVSVERVNSTIYEMTESNESASMASVNMFTSIGAIGDSYTAASTKNSGGTWKDYRNLSWIATMGKRSGTEWKNYGHGGATTKSFLETTEFTQALSDNACDIYFFALGQNDGNQALTIGTVADIHDNDYTLNADTFYGNYGRIIQQIKNHAPNAKLVMITNWVQGSTWTDYDVAIRAIANHYSIPVIEPFDDYFFNSALYQNYKEYGHPTAMGYSSMGIAMERLFSKCVVDNPTYFKFATIG